MCIEWVGFPSSLYQAYGKFKLVDAQFNIVQTQVSRMLNPNPIVYLYIYMSISCTCTNKTLKHLQLGREALGR